METARDRAEVEQASEQASRARTACKQAEQEDDLNPALQASKLTFDTVVAIVERASGTALTGPTRELCRAEYARHPVGVHMCAMEAASRRDVRTPNGLFVRMLRDSDHVRHEAAWHSVGSPASDERGDDGALPAPGAQNDDVRAALARLGATLGVETDLLRSLEGEAAA